MPATSFVYFAGNPIPGRVDATKTAVQNAGVPPLNFRYVDTLAENIFQDATASPFYLPFAFNESTFLSFFADDMKDIRVYITDADNIVVSSGVINPNDYVFTGAQTGANGAGVRVPITLGAAGDAVNYVYISEESVSVGGEVTDYLFQSEPIRLYNSAPGAADYPPIDYLVKLDYFDTRLGSRLGFYAVGDNTTLASVSNVTFSASANTITLAGIAPAAFLNEKRFVVAYGIRVSGTSSNNQDFSVTNIEDVSGDTIITVGAGEATDEGPVSGVDISFLKEPTASEAVTSYFVGTLNIEEPNFSQNLISASEGRQIFASQESFRALKMKFDGPEYVVRLFQLIAAHSHRTITLRERPFDYRFPGTSVLNATKDDEQTIFRCESTLLLPDSFVATAL